VRFIRGFTLIELMITVAVVAILSAIALPSYSRYVLRTGRTEGRNLLVSTAALQERFRYANPGYAPNLAALGITNAMSENNRYELSMSVAGTNNQTFTLTATPKNSQTSDTCGALTLTHAGVKGAAGTDCWK
jgi:type IV pilus assembly protein PilE